VIVKNVAGDENEVRLKLSGLIAELLESGEPGLADPVAGVLVETRDSQAQVKIGSVKQTDHKATIQRELGRWPRASVNAR
jgi:hypothetical protein